VVTLTTASFHPLLQALTGRISDRLGRKAARITIDLGFAFLDEPGVRLVVTSGTLKIVEIC